MHDIASWCDLYTDCEIILGGDFNSNLDKVNDDIAKMIGGLIRCDDLFPSQKVITYCNLSLSHESQIDYIATSSPHIVTSYKVLDPDINFSDRFPSRSNWVYRLIVL